MHIRGDTKGWAGNLWIGLVAWDSAGCCPAQSSPASIHLLWAWGLFAVLPRDSIPCHPDEAALLKRLACSGHFCMEASAPIALPWVLGVLWYLLCARDGSSSSLPHPLHMQIHTLQAVQYISREWKVVAKNTYVQVIYGPHQPCGTHYTMLHKEVLIWRSSEPVLQPTSNQRAILLAFQLNCRNLRSRHSI